MICEDDQKAKEAQRNQPHNSVALETYCKQIQQANTNAYTTKTCPKANKFSFALMLQYTHNQRFIVLIGISLTECKYGKTKTSAKFKSK